MFKNKRKSYIILTLFFIVFFCIGINKSERVIKEYNLNKINESIKTSGTHIKDNEYIFSADIQLGEEPPLSSGILEMKLYAQIEEGKDKDKFILENTKLEVNPIGCREYDKGAEYIKENLYSKNFQFGIRPNERFEQLMAFKYTKFLSENKNIKINRVDNINSLYKIKSLKSLQGTDGDNRVLVDYNTLEQCFSQWFNVTFKLNSKTEGEFIVSY